MSSICFRWHIYKRIENIYISLFFKIIIPTTKAPNITYVNVLSWFVVVEAVFGKLDDAIFGEFEYGVVVGITTEFGSVDFNWGAGFLTRLYIGLVIAGLGLGVGLGAVLGNLGGVIIVGGGVIIAGGGTIEGVGVCLGLGVGLVLGGGFGGLYYNIIRLYYLLLFLLGINAYIPTKTVPIIIYKVVLS